MRARPYPALSDTPPFFSHSRRARSTRPPSSSTSTCPSCIGINHTYAVGMIAKYTNHAMTKLHLSYIAERHPLEKPASWTEETMKQSSIFRYVQKGDAVLDLGANIGRSGIVAAEAAGPEGRVVSSEADPSNRGGTASAPFIELWPLCLRLQTVRLICKRAIPVWEAPSHQAPPATRPRPRPRALMGAKELIRSHRLRRVTFELSPGLASGAAPGYVKAVNFLAAAGYRCSGCGSHTSEAGSSIEQLVANLATGTTMFRGTNIGAWTNLVCFAPGVDPAAWWVSVR